MDLQEEIRQLLMDFGIRLNTNLGQHFLIDEEVLQDILDAAEIDENDHIVEIGPGVGVLTRELLTDAAHVTAIELDARFGSMLRKFVGKELEKKLTLIQGNALNVPFPQEPYKIVANIPYHITSPLLRHAFIESPVRPTTLTLLMQREVAEKICDTEQASILTIIVSLFGAPSIVRRVPPSSFLPPPEVQSAVLHIKSHPKPLASPKTIERIFWLTKMAFSQKRKMIRNTLGKIENGPALLKKANIDLTRRPETLQIEEWIHLAEASLS
jgi:16S rRNA (adenine1518-N6/adenine1519-N6)-dimethyltransferase